MSERAEKNAGLVRAEDRGRTLDANRGGGHGLAIPEKRGWKLRLVNRQFSCSFRFFLPVCPSESSSISSLSGLLSGVMGADGYVPPRKVYKGDAGQV